MSKLKKIRYNCRQATFLIEKKQEQKITFREQIELRIHLIGCGVCRIYEKQSVMISQMVTQLFTSATETPKLDEQFKKQMQDKIEEELKK